jgi:hypothetical protein
MYQTGYTIKKTLDQIQSNELVLPAIQREFVWRPEQICRLFDSLMQGYPFGTFLYWQVNRENSDKFKFYDFVLNYHQKNNRHNPNLPMMSDRNLTAVLDGQQRLTALNIGLRGSMALKQPKLWWSNPNAFPICKLYLDLLWQPDEDDEEGLKYRFNFRTDEEIAVVNEKECWFLVRDILSMSSGPAMVRWLNSQLPQEQVDLAYETLDELHKVVHTDHLIAFYEEIEDLADMQYGNRLAFALLSLLFPFVKVYTEQFHIDHIFPVAQFTRHKLRSAGVSDDKIDDFIQSRNGLANLQLLHGVKNIEKSAKMPAEWLKEVNSDSTSRQHYRDNYLLGEIPENMPEFDTFYNARRERLKAKIKRLLGR